MWTLAFAREWTDWPPPPLPTASHAILIHSSKCYLSTVDVNVTKIIIVNGYYYWCIHILHGISLLIGQWSHGVPCVYWIYWKGYVYHFARCASHLRGTFSQGLELTFSPLYTKSLHCESGIELKQVAIMAITKVSVCSKAPDTYSTIVCIIILISSFTVLHFRTTKRIVGPWNELLNLC